MSEIQMKPIQWFPGHMAKTRRMIAANLSMVDAVVEILDARIPQSSRNPEMDRMLGNKPRMLLLNKADTADAAATAKWVQFYQKKGILALPMDCKTGRGVKNFLPIRLMVVGIPNVGKSSFINRMAQSKRAKVEDRPGVTRNKQWVKIGDNMELLDMPGVLWPKFDDQEVAKRLAFTGAIHDDIMDLESLAMLLLEYLAQHYPEALQARYKMQETQLQGDGLQLLEQLGRNRGMLISGGEVNYERAAITILDEFRSGKLGRITLEWPEAKEV